MNNQNTILTAIRNRTRVALPKDDGYLFRLGIALYGFAYVNNFMAEVLSHLDATKDRTLLTDWSSHDVLKAFQPAAEAWMHADISSLAQIACTEFARLNNERTDFVHAYPITNPAGEQILHRRKDAKGKYFEVTNDFLEDFISRLTKVTDALYRIRATIRPDL